MKKYFFVFNLIILFFCFSCKEYSKVTLKNKEAHIKASSKESDQHKNNISRFSDTLKNWSLPIGNELLLTKFPKKWEFDIEAPEDNKYEALTESISKYTDSLLYNTNYLIAKDSSNLQAFKANKYYNYYEDYVDYNYDRNIKETISVPIARLINRKQIDLIFEIEAKPSGASFINMKTINKKGTEIDGINLGYTKNVYTFTHSGKYFYIDKNMIIHVKHFLSIDNQTLINYYEKFQILSSGKIVRYFDLNIGDYNSETEKGKLKNHTQIGEWVAIKNNKYAEGYTYLEATYKEGKPIGKWNYYNLINETQKGSKLLMTEEYSGEGKLLKRTILGDD